MQEYLQLLRNNREFTKLWLAQVVSSLGDWFSTIVLAALINRYAPEYTGLAITGFLLARLIPPILMSPFNGVLADRFNRKKLMLVSDIVRGVIVLFLLFVDGPDRLWLLYTVVVIQFALFAIFHPARNAILPSVVDKKDLVLANTLGSVTWSVMLAVGAVAGGVVASLFGYTVALIVDSMTFFLSAWFIYRLNYDPAKVAQLANESVDTSDDRSYLEGLRFLARYPSIASSVFIKAFLHMGSIDTILIIYGTKLFVMGEDGTISMAILWSAFGVGAILGPLLLNRYIDDSLESLRRMVGAGFLLVTLGWFFWGWSTNFVLVILAILVRSMGGSATWTYSSVLIQKTVPDQYLGRMFSLDIAAAQVFVAISVVLTGYFVDQVGEQNVSQVLYWTAGLSIIPTVGWFLISNYLSGKKEPMIMATSTGN